MADERGKAIEAALSQLEKQFGKGSIMRLGSKEAIVPISVISTGSISFDAALGVGGVPRGRVIEIFGPESSGKTTITLQIIAEAQKAGGLAAFVDAEHALDPAYAKKLGVATTENCCLATARDAMFRNYRVVFLSDATATYDYPDRGFGAMPNADVHHATLVILAASTAHAMSVADLATRLPPSR